MASEEPSPPDSSSVPPDLASHPWRWLLHSLRCLRRPPKRWTDEERARSEEQALERSVPWSVLAVELVVTVFVLSFGVISLWYGAWTMLDLAMEALFPGEPWKGVLMMIGLGLAVLVGVALLSRTWLARAVYRPHKAGSWGEYGLRSGGDRAVLLVQAWGSVAIWKGVWDLWRGYIWTSSRWGAAGVAHGTGIGILLALFGLRSAVMPPMTFVEDSIYIEQMSSRWNLISRFIISKRAQQMSSIERQFNESEATMERKM